MEYLLDVYAHVDDKDLIDISPSTTTEVYPYFGPALCTVQVKYLFLRLESPSNAVDVLCIAVIGLETLMKVILTLMRSWRL